MKCLSWPAYLSLGASEVAARAEVARRLLGQPGGGELRGGEDDPRQIREVQPPLAIAELGSDGEAQWWNRAAAELFDWSDRSVPRRIPVRSGSELVLAGLVESAFGGKPLIGIDLPVTGAAGEPLPKEIV